MIVIYLIIIFLHGLIHLPGFVKAFGLKEVNELTLPVSRPMGLLWLLAAILLLVYGILHSVHARYAWLIGLLAVALSQTLVILFWKDARFGSVPNLLILLVVLVSLGGFLIRDGFSAQVKEDFQRNRTASVDILTEKDMAHLPAPVQKYLRFTRSVGQQKVRNFRAEFTGRMRSKPKDDWMQLKSVQYNFIEHPSRYFYMEAQKMGLPATGLHTYRDASATFRVKMLNWLPVVDAKGDKLSQAETVTLFNDMCFIAPPTLIDPGTDWETINDTTVKAIFRNGTFSISAVLYFNAEGQLVNFISNDRFDTDGRRYDNFPWATPVADYRMINGYMLPGRANLIYKRKDGDFVYGELVFKSVKYNLEGFED